MAIEALLTFFLIVGVGLCVFYGATMGKVKFTLRSIFLIVTTSCVGFAGFAAFGPDVFYVFGIFAAVVLPPANYIVVAMLTVAVLHSRDERQATFIGMLVPLVCLAISDSIRLGGLLAAAQFRGNYPIVFGIVIFLLAYFTSWVSGHFCRNTYLQLKREGSIAHPLRGAERAAAKQNSEQTISEVVGGPSRGGD